MSSKHSASPAIVWYPVDLPTAAADPDLHGYFQAETGHYVVLGTDPAGLPGCRNLSAGSGIPLLQAIHTEQGWQFTAAGQPCIARPYGLENDLFSRHAGLLETAAMAQCGVIVCGCGSVGSLAALDLARSGVGRFLLIDDDLLSIENLCRHQCGLADLGRTKARAVADRIRLINPHAEVQVHTTTLERLDPAVVAAFATAQDAQGQRLPSLLLAAADSRRADRYGAQLAAQLQLAFLSIGLWERAFAGELFYWHPDAPMPCYGCAFEGLIGSLSRRPEQKRRYYSNESEQQQLDFQPGLAIDIAYVVQVGLKLAIDLLNRHNPDHVPRLLGKLSQYTLVCNSNDDRLGGEAAGIFSHPLQVTSSIQVGYGQDCPTCRWSS